MDQFSAHLDRGWDLVQKGDSRGAELSARRALELDNQSPEAHNLLGYVAALQGEYEEAIEHYRQAIALDDTYLEAMLNAAEVYIHPLGEFDEALEMCEQALDLVENDDERVDALLLKFDALLGSGDAEAARALSVSFPDGPFENPNHDFLVARALYEIGEMSRAAPMIEAAIRREPRAPEAYYYLGLVRDEQGDTPGATQAFLRARELDLDLPFPEWTLTRDAFEMTARQVVEELTPDLKRFLREGEVFVSDLPGVEVVVDGVDPRALLLLDGVSTEDGEPTARLIVYQKNIERLAGSVEAVPKEIMIALVRELRNSFVERPPSRSELN